MSKHNISATVDDDVYEFLQQDHINISGLVNRCLTEYMNTGGDVSAVRDLRIQQLEDEAEELKSRAERKKQKADDLRAEIERVQTEEQKERLGDVLDSASMIPADPSHPFITSHAKALDMTPEQLAEEIADYHGKEVESDDDDDGLNSL